VGLSDFLSLLPKKSKVFLNKSILWRVGFFIVII